ncbi:MAG: type IV pilin protein [Bacteroidota bacterium]
MKKIARLKGMTLTELLVVLAILGILILLAFPRLNSLFGKTYSLEARTNLKYLAELQDKYFMEHFSYAQEFQKVGFDHNQLVSQENGVAHYQIEVVQASRETFLARATAITDFDGDGVFNVWEIDKNGIPREVTPD